MKLVNLVNVITYDERIKVFDEDDNVIFLGYKNELKARLYKSQKLAMRNIIGTMMEQNTIVITIK